MSVFELRKMQYESLKTSNNLLNINFYNSELRLTKYTWKIEKKENI